MIVNAPNGLRGRVSAVLGPTNTGKTHLAVQTMLDHSDGVIGLPLRLLAREVYDRIVAEKGVGNVALVTGEEKIVPQHAHYYVCTVEAMPTGRNFQFVAIDEIQLCADPERGHVFTDRLLHMRGTETTVFMGSDTIGPLIRRIIPDAAMVTRPRLSKLSYSGPCKLSKLPRRSAIVTFSAADVYAIGELMRRQRGGAAVVLGALSPRTRNAQVAMYQAGEVDFLVATDAIGMGLNMDVRHVAFAGSRKFDGERLRGLMPQEVGQIAGRAGRYTSDGSFGVTADVESFDEDLIQQIEDHKFENLTHLRWRSARLDYKSPQALVASLEAKPPASHYIAPRQAQDLKTLKSLLREDDIHDAAAQRDMLIRLWQVCQIPDFRKTMHESHVRLLAQAYRYLAADDVLPDHWIEKNINQLDRLDGEIDALQTRLAHIRTWTYISHRSDWISDAAAWQTRARNVEDRLSDALHEKLAQRFVDRRTATLVNRLRDRELVNASIDIEGKVSVEDQYVGRLHGLSFEVDPGALENKALKSAVNQVLADALVARSHKIAKAMDEMLRLENDGRILWLTVPIATLVKGSHILKPSVRLIASDQLPEKSAELINNRLLTWIEFNVNKHLKPLQGLEDADMSPAAKGVAFQLLENVGVMRRDKVSEQMRNLDPKDYGRFKYRGVTLGRFSIFSSLVLKPEPTRWRAILGGLVNGEEYPVQEEIGRVSYPMTGDVDEDKLLMTGYRRFGELAVRVDMVERMAAHAYRATKEGEAEADHELMSMLGGGPERLAPVLAALGYVTERENEESPLKYKRKPRPQRNRSKNQRDRKGADGNRRAKQGGKNGGNQAPRTAQANPPRKKGREYDPDSPFAALAALKKA